MLLQPMKQMMDSLKKTAINASKRTYMVGESVKLNQDGNYAYATLENFTGYICEKS